MDKITFQRIKPRKRRKCQYKDGCEEIATNIIKVASFRKKYYVCDKHMVQFMKEIVVLCEKENKNNI